MMIAEGIRCAAHPAATATATCGRCGAFTCADCPSSPFYKDHCPSCTARMVNPASSRAMVALAVGGLSLACYCPVIGFGGVVLGNAELAAINRGEAPEAGRTYARAGMIMGWIGVGLTVAILLIGGGIYLASRS